MKNTLILLILGLVFLFLGQAQACTKTAVLEDISLPGQKMGEGYFMLMEISEGIEALCSTRSLRGDLFDEARSRLQYQTDLISLLVRDGELKPNQERYYRGFLKDVLKNLNNCEVEANRMRKRGEAPNLKKLVELNIRTNDIVDIFYLFYEGSSPRKHIISHKIWFGRIIQEDGHDLCQTNLK